MSVASKFQADLALRAERYAGSLTGEIYLELSEELEARIRADEEAAYQATATEILTAIAGRRKVN